MCAQLVKNANLFGRIGSGIGQGLSEQLPKEMERGRLSEGLKQFEKDSPGLTPLQQFSRIHTIPGITPAMTQALPEILKNESYRNAYQRRGTSSNGRGNQDIEEPRQSFSVADINFANQNKERAGNTYQNQDLVRPNEQGQPQIQDTNPVRNEALPGIPFTQSQWLDKVAQYSEEFPNASPSEWRQMASEEESRMLARPEAQQKYDQYLEDTRKKIETEFNIELERHLHKTGKETFKDIGGDLQSNMQRTIERDIKANPRASIADVVKKRVNELFEFAKARNDIDEFATAPISDFLTHGKRENNFNRLKSFSNIYNDLDRNEELFDKLRTHTVKKSSPNEPRPIGLGLTPMKAAGIAYPIKNVPGLGNYLKSAKSEKASPFDAEKTSIAHAIKVEPYLSNPKSSILSIANELRQSLPAFNSNAFFNQIREDYEAGSLNLSGFQKRELDMGSGDIFPNWNDFFYLPLSWK